VRMIRPQLAVETVTLAEEQEEYLPLTVAVLSPNADLTPPYFVISAYRLSDEERAAVAAGADLYLALTCVDGRSINPQQLIVGKEACAAAFGLSPDPETP